MKNMKNIYKFILILFVGITLTNCTQLDADVSDFIPGDEYPENADQAIRVANPVFAKTKDLLDNGGWWFIQVVSSDEAVAPTRGSDWDDGGKWRALHQHTWGATTEAVNQTWGLIYDAVPRANRAIELLEVGAEASPEVAQVLAQTIVSRAYYYFLAIDNFGDVPFPLTFTGVDEFPSRTPRAEVFNTIVQQILDNVDLLPVPVPGISSSAINQGTAYALLAKLYLNAEVYTGTPMWQKAYDACEKVKSFGYSLESNPSLPFITNNSGSVENIYTIPYDEDKYRGFNFHMRTLHYLSQQTFDMSVAPWNGFAVLEATYNLFGSNDLRKYGLLVGQQKTVTGVDIIDEVAGANLVFTPNIPAILMPASDYSSAELRNSGVRIAKWEIKAGARDNLSNDFAIFRYADIILMQAEALVRMNGRGAGDALVNQIKNRSNAQITGNYGLQDILDERSRELLWEGWRRNDLIRFGQFSKTWWEKNDNDINHNLLPVPQYAINANSNLLPQNPGY
ncbi:RagB/SusD family nutrient uptake outer membrane protein [Lutibacter sp. HS1-25]|nr:RagB/SusD family nutrient uptake outer membrane protein [Lutibacter sp. HS1-25]